MDKIAVLIPCYNEELSIVKVIEDCKKYIPEAIIYVYDNNSKDKSVELAKNAGAIIKHEYQQGKGNVIRRMFRERDAECYLMVDADDTYDLSFAPEMIELVLNKNADMVVGDRLSSTYFTENKRPFHNFGNTLVKFFTNHLFKGNIRDVMTGFRAFSYQYVKSFPCLSSGFEIETEMTIFSLDKKMQLENVVIQYRDRHEGSFSKLNTFKDGFKVLLTIAKLTKCYRPLFFYSIFSILFFIPGLVLTILGSIKLSENFLNNNSTNLFNYSNFIPLSIGCLLIIISFIFLAIGLILKVIHTKDKQEFEHYLQIVDHDFKTKSNKN